MDRGEHYFAFLVHKVDGFGAWRDRIMLLHLLFDTEYRWDFCVPLDADRAEDGKSLRLLYFHETGFQSCMAGEPCNVLEMLLAMAIDMENIMGEPGEDHPERWFWEMLGNIGLADMTDDKYDAQTVIDAIGNWMARNYDRRGKGGIFPLHRSRRDVRRMPIWEQAGMYMTERC